MNRQLFAPVNILLLALFLAVPVFATQPTQVSGQMSFASFQGLLDSVEDDVIDPRVEGHVVQPISQEGLRRECSPAPRLA